ncbi:type I polyketide synthase [Aspergillus lucknowensis]|uniref:Polyketide synthase n=1 Tax=Aspergillus lucknowensis TaxID=176173 RepID=A0ABR4M7Q3_9EURO
MPLMISPEPAGDDIAVIGLACRFPGEASGPQQFWDLLCKGRSAYSSASKRWNVDAFHHSKRGRLGTSVTAGGHFLEQDLAAFDAAFFNISQNEASSMDPQQRLNSTGCYIGSFTSDWREALTRDAEAAPMYTLTGVGSEFLSNRVSWFFNMKGPSLTLNTACSSSLVAFHLACQSLRTRESSMAIAGGVSVHLNPDFFMYLSNLGFLGQDGRSKTFDASGDGYGRGEGCGVIVLKRVEDAIRDGDNIRAIVRGTGVNQDGKTKGITLPNAVAQAELIKATYQSAGLDMGDTQYFEAHGTGTQAGDPTELEAVSLTIGSALPAGKQLLVGSVKPNIGHLEASAGIAGVIKGVLALESGLIPPSILFNTPNPKIQFQKWKVAVPTTLTPWPGDGVRRMSVNSFGVGGTNAHAVLDGAEHYLRERGGSQPARISDSKTTGLAKDSPRLFMISSHDQDGLSRQRESLAKFIQTQANSIPKAKQDNYLHRLAYTLSERRSALPWKTCAVASDLEELVQELSGSGPSGRFSESPRLGFIFTGQGAQWARMGMELRRFDVFESSLESAEAFFKRQLNCPWSVIEEMERIDGESKINLPEYSQALCTVLQVAIVELLASWGVTPTAVAGHSSGEIGAAYCLGALTREDAWTIAYYRGILSARIPEFRPDLKGSMIAVGLGEEEAEKYIARVTKGAITVACVNSPSSVTVSGDVTGIDELQDLLRQDAVFERKLKVGVAYHSTHMMTIASQYLDAIGGIEPTEEGEDRKMYSSVSGEYVEADELGAMYWVQNLTNPVRFSDAVQSLVLPVDESGQRQKKAAVDILVEIGPHSALGGPVKQILNELGVKDVDYKSVLSRGKHAAQTALQCVGSLSVQGVAVEVKEINQYHAAPVSLTPLHDLPSYVWNHSRTFWAEPRVNREHRMREHPRYSLVGAPLPRMSENERDWKGLIRISEEPWVRDHRIQNLVLYPAAGYIAMAIEGARQLADESRIVAGFRLRDIQIGVAATVTEDADLEIMLHMRPHAHGTRDKAFTWWEFSISTCAAGQELRQNCAGLLLIEYTSGAGSPLSIEAEIAAIAASERYAELQTSCTVQEEPKKFYEDLAALGLEYGPTFSTMTEIRLGKGASCCTVEVSGNGSTVVPPASIGKPYIIHPTTLDAMFHAVFAALKGPGGILKGAMVPKSIDEITIAADMDIAEKSLFRGFATAAKHGFREIMSDVHMLDDGLSKQAVSIRGFCCADVAGAVDVADAGADAVNLCTTTAWLPAIELLSSEQLQSVVDDLATDAPELQLSRAKAQGLVKLSVQTTPGQSVVEISETGLPILADGSGVSAIDSLFDYTIASNNADWLKSAEEQLKASNMQAKFTTLDGQTLAEASFDIVLATIAAGDEEIQTILKQLSKLAKAGARVCLIEQLSANEAELRTHAQWSELLQSYGLQVQFTSFAAQSSLTVAALPSTEAGAVVADEVVVLEATNPSPVSQAIAAEITEQLHAASIASSRTTLADSLATLKGKRCISLLELESSVLEDLSQANFDALKEILLSTSNLLWFVGFEGPAATLITGLARSIRNEIAGLELCTLLAPVSSFKSPGGLASAIVTVAISSIRDNEIRAENGVLQVSRLLEDESLSNAIAGLQRGEKVLAPLSQTGRPQKLAIQNPGLLDSLCFELDESLEQDIGEDDVEIEVRASGVNFRDVMTAMGQIPDETVGLEASGVVRQVGANVTKFQRGDRVCCLGQAAHKPLIRVPAVQCKQIPEGMSFEDAATLPIVHYTAYHALVNLARVRKGQSILIHAAAGGVGQAAIQIAQHFGMEVFATVGSEPKRKLIKDVYGIQDDHIFNSRDVSFVKGLLRMTKGRGVDCVLNSLSGEMLRQTWYCLAPFGVFVEIGLKDILSNSGLDMLPFKKHATFCFFNLDNIAKINPQLIADIGDGVFDLLRQGALKPVFPVTVYPVSQMESAFRLMQAGRHQGKLVLSYSPEDVVPMLRRADDALRLDPNATYVLVGGFGGLGRSLIRMFAASGARHLAVFSRSGAASAAAQACVEETEKLGTQVHVYQCDVSNGDAVKEAVEQIQGNLPPIKGVIQGAMVLRDVLFEQMTYQQWVESTRPKVQGTWNLHEYLPASLDFFITLSSFAGVFGNRGQGNYAAAGAYEDALAHHRRSQGLRAVTIDLGVMRDSGVLAEQGTTANLKDFDSLAISDATFHAMIKKVIVDELSGSSTPPQITTGMPTGKTVQAAGIDRPYFFDDARFSIISQAGAPSGASASGEVSIEAQLSRVVSRDEGAPIVQEALVNRVAKFLQTSPSEIDPSKPLYHYGVDSLAAVEMRNWVFREIKAEVSLLEVMSASPIAQLSQEIANRSKLLK